MYKSQESNTQYSARLLVIWTCIQCNLSTYTPISSLGNSWSEWSPTFDVPPSFYRFLWKRNSFSLAFSIQPTEQNLYPLYVIPFGLYITINPKIICLCYFIILCPEKYNRKLFKTSCYYTGRWMFRTVKMKQLLQYSVDRSHNIKYVEYGSDAIDQKTHWISWTGKTKWKMDVDVYMRAIILHMAHNQLTHHIAHSYQLNMLLIRLNVFPQNAYK